MKTYQMNLPGYDSSKDNTDDFVRWVNAPNLESVRIFARRIGAENIEEIPLSSFEDGVDYEIGNDGTIILDSNNKNKIYVDPVDDTILGSEIVPRKWVEIISPLFEKFNLDYHGFPKQSSDSEKSIITETNKFRITPGYNFDCDCSNQDNPCSTCHDEYCEILTPNFLYKPTGFRINWYKYPMRSAIMIPAITTKEFMAIILDCLEN